MTFLTEVASATDVITYLDTNWVTATAADAIAKPTFKEAFYGEIATDGNTILVGWQQISLESTDLGTQNDEFTNLFEIIIMADNVTDTTARSDLLKMASQVRRHSNRTITNGEWHLDSIIPIKFGHEQFFACSLRQTIYYLGD